ncbi:MAG: glutaredoxin domain-containing protein [Actinomycetota bacterium]
MERIEAIELYWRPGCPFCMRLEHAIDTANIPTTKRNIWDDPDAAAFVRSVADGNETVPTVRVGERSFVNPSPAELTKVLEADAPHLLEQ